MLPLLASRLCDSVGPEALPAGLLDRLGRSLTQNRAAAMSIGIRTAHITEALAEHGIAALALKGPGLAQRAHGDPGLRSVGDIDLLVSPADLAGAVSVVRALGHATPQDPVGPSGLPRLHFALRHPQWPTVELHWRVHWYETAFSGEMLTRATPDADGLLTAHPVDELASLLLFYARDGFYGLRMLADITGWWDRHPRARQSGLLDPYVVRHPALARVWRAASLAAERVGGIPVRALVTGAAPPDLRVRLAVRLGSWSQRGDRDQLAANMTMVDGFLSPPRGVLEFLDRAYASPSGRVRHGAKVTTRFALGLGRTWRGPWDPLPPSRPA